MWKTFRKSSTVNSHQRMHTGEKPNYHSKCGKSFRYISFAGHKKTLSVNKPYWCMTIGKPLQRAQLLLNIREFILDKHPITIRNVGKPSGIAQTLLNIREPILGKNLMNVINVRRLFSKVQPLNSTGKFITKKGHQL